MPATISAQDFGSEHVVRGILPVFYGFFCSPVKGWPSAMTLKFTVAGKESGATSFAGIISFFKMKIINTGMWYFGSFFTKNMVLLFRELGAPLVVCFFNVVLFRAHGVLQEQNLMLLS